jgi:hypothetical protein
MARQADRLTLGFACAQVDAGAHCFEHGKGTALTIEQRVVRLATVVEGIFETYAAAVRELPLGVLQKLVDLTP